MIYTSIFLNVLVSLILILNYWSKNRGVVYLVVAILAISLRQLIILLLNTNGDPEVLALLYLNCDPILFLIGPTILFYFKSVLKGKHFLDFSLILHLLPATIALINTAPYYTIPLTEKVAFVKQLQVYQNSHINPFPFLILSYKWQKVLMPIINFSYALYTVYYVSKMRKSGTIFIKKRIDQILNHGLFFVIIVVSLTLAIYLYWYVMSLPNFSFAIPGPLLKSFFYVYSLVVPISFFLLPSWLYGDKEGQNLPSRLLFSLRNPFKKIVVEEEDSEFRKSEDLDRILQYLEQGQPYLQEKFSIHDISRNLNIPYVRVTNSFNKQLSISFPIYRNKLRIEYATNLLKSGAHLTTSIEGIASKSGFKSKTAFYTAFKAEYGVNPVDWIRENL